jgi:hypothetical protein
MNTFNETIFKELTACNSILKDLISFYNGVLRGSFLEPGDPNSLFEPIPVNQLGGPESQKGRWLDEFDQLTSRCLEYLSLCKTLTKCEGFDSSPVEYVIYESMEAADKVCSTFECLAKTYRGRSIITNCALGQFIADSNEVTQAAINARDRLSHDSKLLDSYLEGIQTQAAASEAKPKELEAVHLTEDQASLLQWYNDQYPAICYLQAYNGRTDKTNRKNADFLRKIGLIERPEGKNRGDFITENGRSYLNEHY